MRILTIGFTKLSAKEFFRALKKSKAKRILDVRLRNNSQLAGFSQGRDLPFFLKEMDYNMGYEYGPELAPEKGFWDKYMKSKKKPEDWKDYERNFMSLMKERRIEKQLKPEMLEDACLLCSEDKPHFCHRRLVAEYLQKHWGNVEIEHIVKEKDEMVTVSNKEVQAGLAKGK